MSNYDPSQDYSKYPTLAPLPEEVASCLAKCSACGSQDFHIKLPGWIAVCKACETVLDHPAFTSAPSHLPTQQKNSLPFSAFQFTAVPSDKWYAQSYIVLRPDGTVRTDSYLKHSLREVIEWTQIVSIVSNSAYIAGLRTDGTVTAVGLSDNDYAALRSWTDITAIAAMPKGIIGLCSNGTVQAIGLSPADHSQLAKWSNIVSIAVGRNRIAGLRSDGTVRAIGGWNEVYGWEKITAIASAGSCIVGLRENGTITTAGIISGTHKVKIEQCQNVKSISVGVTAVAAAHKNGKVSVCKYSADSPLTSKEIQLSQTWSNIESVWLSTNCIIARRDDGFIHCTSPDLQRFIIECLD